MESVKVYVHVTPISSVNTNPPNHAAVTEVCPLTNKAKRYQIKLGLKDWIISLSYSLYLFPRRI
jgi:hypothetical protein